VIHLASSTVALVIVGVMLVLYVSDVLPIALTSILACLALVIFGVIPLNAAFTGFGNDTVFMIAGMMVVGAALFETGAADAIGKRIVSIVGTNERIFIAAMMLVSVPFSAFLSNTATAAIMLPIATSAIAASGGKLTKKNTYMAIGITCVAGGGLTLVSSTPQLIAQGLLREGGYETIGFFELGATGLPILALLFVYCMTIGFSLQKKIFNFPELPDAPEPPLQTKKITAESTVAQSASDRANISNVDNIQYALAQAAPAQNTPAPKSVVRMSISVGALVFCIIGFITGLWTLGIVAVSGAALCVVTGCISQKKVFQKMDWTTLIIMGCSFVVAAGLEQSGAGALIARSMISLLGDKASPWLLCSILALTSVLLTNFMSSTATSAILLPIAVLTAAELGYDVKIVAMSVAIATNIGYATPISTPPLTMTLPAGYRFMDYVKYGGLFNLLAYILVVLLFGAML